MKYIKLNLLVKDQIKTVHLCFNVQQNKFYSWHAYVNDFKEKAINEYEMLKRISSKYVPKVYDLFQDENGFVVIEDLIIGPNIREMSKISFGKLSVHLFNNILVQIIELLKDLKQSQVFHRNIDSTSIIFHDQLFLVNFEVACVGEMQNFIGQSGFVAPQVYSQIFTHECDEYSMAMVLLELITSDIPFKECTNIESNVLKNKLPLSLNLITDEVKKLLIKMISGHQLETLNILKSNSLLIQQIQQPSAIIQSPIKQTKSEVYSVELLSEISNESEIEIQLADQNALTIQLRIITKNSNLLFTIQKYLRIEEIVNYIIQQRPEYQKYKKLLLTQIFQFVK